MLPRNKQIERQGSAVVPTSRSYPRVIGGMCEYCGLQDKNVESHHQYKLCEHYRGMQLRCSYCPEGKDSNEVIRRSHMKIYDNPQDPNSLIVVCDTFECESAHQKRFKVTQ